MEGNLRFTPRHKPKEEWLKGPLEYARVEWMCRICQHPIEFGQQFYRGPAHNAARAHKRCVDRLKK
jgi:hypothetical protein